MQSQKSGMLLVLPIILLASFVIARFEGQVNVQEPFPPAQTNPSGCLSCHAGILPFAEGKMMEKIEARGRRFGDPQGCTICHGGTPSAVTAADAHRDAAPPLGQDGGPQDFYPNPGALPIAPFTCGQCHEGYPQRVLKSLSSTKTEEMHRNLCLYALKKKNKSRFGAYPVADEDGGVPSIGTARYREIMVGMAMDADLFTHIIDVPPELDDSQRAQLQETGEWTQACAACHDTGVPEKLEEFHGTGCAACHVPYRRGGTYMGNDPTIDKTEPGKLLVHRLQGTENTEIALPKGSGAGAVAKEAYHGIALDNCFVCHNDVREEALNPIGSVISHYGSFHRDRMGGALLCQDCHTTVDMHGDGNIPVTTRAQIEIRCEDCHGTVTKAPWELPLGYDGTPGETSAGAPRGLTDQHLDLPGARYEAADGYLLTSRGNAFGNVVKRGDQVVLHSASGLEFLVPVLKAIRQNKSWKSPLSRQTKFEVAAHSEKMACMSCHKDQVQPPCLSCHVTETRVMGE